MRFLLIALCLSFCSSTVHAGMLGFEADNFGYTGSWTRYDTLADAQTGMNIVELGTIPQRDIAFYMYENIPSNPFSPTAIALTRWYDPVSGNPNNTNEGFFQFYDDDFSTITSATGTFSPDLSTYSLEVSSVGATNADDFARVGERPGGSGADTRVNFYTVDFDLTVDNLNTSFNAGTGLYEGFGTSSSTINGSISGIFENIGPDASRNGFYAFDLQLNNTSWAEKKCYTNFGNIRAFSDSTTATVPEPSSMALMGIGMVGLLLRRRRRHNEIN